MSTYVAESQLASSREGWELDLATAWARTPDGIVENPEFFTGFLDRPDVFAAGLLAVADVASTRYVDTSPIVIRDPVVTGSGDRLRFESFSGCNGVYARFDLLSGGLGGNRASFGTTNVDVSPPLRMAMAGISRAEPLHLSVGHDELVASTFDETHVERKVALPDRWVRGFAEVPLTTELMRPVGTLVGPQIGQLMASLPRVAAPGPDLYVRPYRPRWLVARTPTPGAVHLAGATRLRGCERVLRLATKLDVYGADNGASAWVFELPSARLTLVLSPEPFRGFSGEGSLLTFLAHPEAERLGMELLDEIGWESTIDPGEMAVRTGRSDAEISSGLAWLAASGRLGYDLTDRSWFHRELPIDPAKVLRRNPRLADAQKLLASGGVSPDGASWRVRGSSEPYYTVSEDLTCTCRWEERHHGTRGPCKHILAVLLHREGAADEASPSSLSSTPSPDQ
jgi:hypothetical protein